MKEEEEEEGIGNEILEVRKRKKKGREERL